MEIGRGSMLRIHAGRDATPVPGHSPRNFTGEAALPAGVEGARCDVALLEDADLPHPPESRS